MTLQTKDIKIPTIQGILKQWQDLSENYSQMDSSPQTFFYTIANMLKLEKSKNILQIACGTGKLIPMILDLKSAQSNYYATDISQKMLQILHIKLRSHFQKYQSNLTFQEWIHEQKLKIKVVNGQQNIFNQIKDEQNSQIHKFDRIIANLVLMLTPYPQKMLKNLSQNSVKGCLFGLTIWGNKQNHNYYTIFPQLSKLYGFPEALSSRSNFHLYKKIKQLAQNNGWQVLLNWQQNSIIPYLNYQQAREFAHIATSRMGHLNNQQKIKLEEGFVQKVKQILQKQKQSLNFAGECYILRKN